MHLNTPFFSFFLFSSALLFSSFLFFSFPLFFLFHSQVQVTGVDGGVALLLSIGFQIKIDPEPDIELVKDVVGVFSSAGGLIPTAESDGKTGFGSGSGPGSAPAIQENIISGDR